MVAVTKYAVIVSLLACGLSVPQAKSQTNISNTWSSTGQLTEARTGAAAVHLLDGRILITGGTDSSGVPQASAEVYDPATGAFSALPEMNVPRAKHAAIVLYDSDVLVTGGLTTGGGYSDSAEIYSVSSNKWTLLQSSIGTGLAGQAMVLLPDGNVLIAGGTSTTKVVGSIILFNLTDQTFTPIGTLLTARTNAAAAATPDGRVLIVGGADINGALLASTEIFTYTASTMTGTIAAGPAMSYPREYATATSTYDGVAVIGGNNGQNDLGTAEIFSQWTNTFKVVTGGTPRSHHFAVLLPKNGSILAMGGTGGTAVDLLQPWANNKAGAFVAAAPSLVNQDGGFASPASLGSLLAAGGMGSSASSAELYWFPTVSTDKAEYAPGTPVNMTGAGFKPSETVDLHLHLWVDQSTQDVPDATATADSSGNFSYDGYAPNNGDIGARYHLTAVGETSGYQAQTTFGDDVTSLSFTNPPLNQATGACGTLTLDVGGTAPYTSPIYIYDSGSGTFYSNAGCTTALPSSITATSGTVTIYFKDATAESDTVYATTTSILGFPLCLTTCATQAETIYGAATKLAWSALPGGGTPGAVWAQQPAVEVLDSGGNKVSESTASILLTLSTNPGPAGTALTCTQVNNTTPAVAGVAQFSGCSINNGASAQYCITASAPSASPALTSTTAACFYVTNPVSASLSTVVSSVVPPATVLDNGTAYATITVTLNDSSGNPVGSKVVTLAASSSTSNVTTITGTTNSSGQATFHVFDTHPETVTYTATDTTDGIVVTPTAQVIFAPGSVSASNSTISAVPASVTDDGVEYSIITVTLMDSSGDVVAGKTVTLTQGAGASTINVGVPPGTAGNSTTTNANGVATFTVTDTTVQSVTYTAADTTDSTTLTHTAAVSFVANGTAVTLAWTTAPPASAAVGAPFTVAASPTPSGDTGTISYSVTGSCTIAGAIVTMTSSAGSCTVTAVIAARTVGTTHYNSATISATVTPLLGTQEALTVTGAPLTAVYNTTFVVGTSGGSGTGAVTFDTTTPTVCTVSGASVTMITGTGTCSITATKAGDTNYNPKTSAAVNVTATLATGTVAVVCPTITYNGQAQTCTSTTNPTGLNVTYTYNGSSTAPTAAGSYTVVGTISDTNYSGSGTATLTINPENVTATAGNYSQVYNGSAITTTCGLTGSSSFITNLSCTDTPSSVGPDVGAGTVTASVTEINGDVSTNYNITYVPGSWSITQASSSILLSCAPGTFLYTGAAITPCTATVTAPGATQTATIAYTNNVNVGTNTASAYATFAGTTDVTGSSAGPVTFSITQAVAMVTLTCPADAYTGSPQPCSVTTSVPVASVTVTYTGTGNTSYGPSTTAPTAAGTYSVTATVVDPNYTGTATATETIGQSTTPTTLTLALATGSSSPSPYGSAVYFDLTISSTSPCPTGTVQFYENGVAVQAPVTLTGSEGCSAVVYETTDLQLTSNTIQALYSGDTNYAPGTSNPLTQMVSTDTTSVTLAASATTLNVDQPDTFTATVTETATLNGDPGPAGTVEFFDSVNGGASTLVDTETLSATSPYTATYTTTTLPAGANSITATYVPSGNDFSGSSSAIDVVTVDLLAPVITWAVPAPIVYPTALSATQLDATASVPGTFVYTPAVGYIPAVGAVPLSVTFTPSDPTTYSSQTATVTLTVTPATTLTIATFPIATSIIYGQTLASSVLSGGVATLNGTPVAGSFAWTSPTTVPPGGTASYSVTFTATDSADYIPATATGSTVMVTPATPTITTEPTAAPISVGQALSVSGLSGGTVTFSSAAVSSTTVAGTWTWTTPALTPTPAGTYMESVTFTPTDTTDYGPVTGTASIVVNNLITPTITWPTASGITYGQALSASTLSGASATYNGTAVTGTFAWTTPATIPGAGATVSESVTFTPTGTNAAEYNTVTNTVTVAVNKATPTITTAPTASAIIAGQSLVSSTLSVGVGSVPGTFAWTTPGTIPTVGADPESVTFTPTDGVDYNPVTLSVTVQVNGVTPAPVTAWPTATSIIYGQPLSDSTLSGGVASVAGSFAWTAPTTTPAGGTQSESVTFTPTDTIDYSAVTNNVSVTVTPATPTVSVWPTASQISLGQALSSSSLTGGTASVPGTYAWTTPTTVPGAGTTSESVTFTPIDIIDYTTVVGTVDITVNNKATPTVTTWPTASAIIYGQTLASSTLTGGTASVAGTFAWTNPTTAPLAGADAESVTFTPTDTADYNTVAGSVTVTVTVTITASGYVVTVSSDDPGTAANCTPQTTPAHGTDASCSLRDALLAALSGLGGITFDSTVFSAPTTITLSNGVLTVPTAAMITGPTTGSGATLANLVTVDGGSASTVFTVGSGVTSASIANLTIQHGKGVAGGIQNAGTLTLTADNITDNSSTGAGAGINNSGTLTLIASTVSSNVATGNGGGIDNSGTLTLTDDTISGNTSSASGGGIYNNATLAISDSTVSGNSAVTASGGGGIDNVSPGTVTLANAIVSGNSVNSAADDFDGVAYTNNDGNIVGVVNGTAVNATAIALAPLGNYGGPTQTMVPLPGSPAICAGLASSIPSGLITDERGLPNTNTSYTGSVCVDSGAVQTNYALSFTTQPLGGPANSDFAAGVTLTESGSPFQPPVTIPLTLNGTGTLSGGSAATVNGVATYTLEVDTAGTGDTLTANLTLNGGLVPPVAISATSSSFTITAAVLDFTLTANPPTSQTVSAGSMATYQLAVAPLSGTYPGTVSFAATGQPSNATVTFNPSTIAADGGAQTVTMTVQTAATVAEQVPPSIGRKLAPLSFALLLLPLFGVSRLRRQGRRLSRLACLLLLLGCTLVGAMMTGCGGTIKQVAKSYTITVTATSGNVQHTASVTLVVQ